MTRYYIKLDSYYYGFPFSHLERKKSYAFHCLSDARLKRSTLEEPWRSAKIVRVVTNDG